MKDTEILNNYYDMNPVYTEEEKKLFSKYLILDEFLSTEDTEEEIERLLSE